MNGCYYGFLNVLDPSVHYDSNGKIVGVLKLPREEEPCPENTAANGVKKKCEGEFTSDEGERRDFLQEADDHESEVLGIPMTVESRVESVDGCLDECAVAKANVEGVTTEAPIPLFENQPDPEQEPEGTTKTLTPISEIQPDPHSMTLVADFTQATPLFRTILRKNWHAVLFYLRTGSFTFSLLGSVDMAAVKEQTQTWVAKRDINGEELWRQLPLHAAICYGAPRNVIEKLIEIEPDALKSPDNFGNLPLHLAFIFGANDTITACLMKAFPASLHVMNYEGLQPIQCSNEICSHSFQSKAELFGALSDYTRAVAENDPCKLAEQLQDVKRQLKAVNDTLFATAPPRKPEAIKEYLAGSLQLPPEEVAPRGNKALAPAEYGPSAFLQEITLGMCPLGTKAAFDDEQIGASITEAAFKEATQPEGTIENLVSDTGGTELGEGPQQQELASTPPIAPVDKLAKAQTVLSESTAAPHEAPVVQSLGCRVMEYCSRTKTWREV